MSTATNNRTELIASKIDAKSAGAMAISRRAGGVEFTSMAEVMDFAKLMAVSQHAVPPHCRNQVGLCLGLAIQAIEWRMSPFAVASKSYVVNDRIGYESQLVHAVIEQRAPIIERLRHEFSGEGQKRKCRVWAVARGESEPLSYTSPEFGAIQPKNSPLWKSKPDLQLYYNTSRDWARIYFPDVILGVYAEDELIEAGNAMASAPKGIAGLKTQLMSTAQEMPDGEPTVEELPSDAPDDIDPPHADEDAIQDQPSGSPSQMTAEELADQEREASGELFPKGRQQYE